jgi:hypothetical protein
MPRLLEKEQERADIGKDKDKKRGEGKGMIEMLFRWWAVRSMGI